MARTATKSSSSKPPTAIIFTVRDWMLAHDATGRDRAIPAARIARENSLNARDVAKVCDRALDHHIIIVGSLSGRRKGLWLYVQGVSSLADLKKAVESLYKRGRLTLRRASRTEREYRIVVQALAVALDGQRSLFGPEPSPASIAWGKR